MPRYEDLRSTLKTGDIVLFSGKSGISNLIKLFSGGKWSHVGMVLKRDSYDEVCVWESTTLNDVADVETGATIKGVQLVMMSERLQRYPGEVNVRTLNKSLTETMLTQLTVKRKELSRRPYERNEMELLRAAWDGLGGRSSGEDLSSLFCSELVAEAYQAMGLLDDYPKGLASNEYTPIDFSSRRALKLNHGYTLSPEIPLQ